MKVEQIKQEIIEKLSKGNCGVSLVLASFSSIYSCRNEVRTSLE